MVYTHSTSANRRPSASSITFGGSFALGRRKIDEVFDPVQLFSLVCCGSFQAIQADTIVPLNFTFTTVQVSSGTSTSLYGINNAGRIVGAYTDSTGTHGFLDTEGVFTTLPFVPTDINNVGQIVVLSSNGVILDTNGALTK
jgi:hypothetical protein